MHPTRGCLDSSVRLLSTCYTWRNLAYRGPPAAGVTAAGRTAYNTEMWLRTLGFLSGV